MMYGLSPMRRALYFILPLVFALILTGIVVVDAARTPHPDAVLLDVALPAEHNWVMFEFRNDVHAGRDIAGTVVSVETATSVLSGEAGADAAPMLFDLGVAGTVDAVEIVWPDGRVQSYRSIPVNARYTVTYPRTAMDSLAQWFEMNGPLYRIGGFVVLGILLILFAVRVVVWAESRTDSHGELFMR